MAVKTFSALREDMPPNTVGAISGTDILNLTDTVQGALTSLASGELYVDTAASNVVKRKP